VAALRCEPEAGFDHRHGFAALKFVQRKGDLHLARRGWRQAVEEPADPNRECPGERIEAARRDTIFGGFVFLDLLKGDPDHSGKLLYFDAEQFAAPPQRARTRASTKRKSPLA
jgi:hypothetical protein